MQFLPETGYLRLNQIIGKRETKSSPAIPAIIPVSRTTWWSGVKSGRYPSPLKLGPRTTAWSVEDIRDLIKEIKYQNPPTPVAPDTDDQSQEPTTGGRK